MNFKTLESHFESVDTLPKVLEYLDEDFKKVNYWASTFQKGLVHDNPSEIKQALVELAGAYINLRIALGIAEYYKKSNELKKYMNIKMEIENNGTRFTSASAEKEASEFVGEYRRVRNIIEAYKESADKSITALQNVNNNLDKEMRKNPEE